jgi:hypothetical protein
MKKMIILVVLYLQIHGAFAQGFVNLNFEGANISGVSPGLVPTAKAIPGWTASYSNGASLTNIYYNASGLIEIVGANSIQGNYYIYLQGDRGIASSIGQTGTIPMTAQSLIFWGNIGGGSVSFDGQTLSPIIIAQNPNYNIYGADISSFAGETGQLLITSGNSPFVAGVTIDNLQFSSSPVPEPAVSTLIGIGLTALGIRRLRQTK